MTESQISKIIKKVQTESEKKMQKYLKNVLDRTTQLFGIHKEDADTKFKVISEQFKSIDQNSEEVRKNFQDVNNKLDNIIVDLSGIKIDMNDISYKVAMNLDRKIDKKHFVDLEGRVRVLEKK